MLNATILQKLEGHTRSLAGVDLHFVQSGNGKPATWAGGEGFAAPVDVPGAGRHIFKIFKLPTPERRARARFLSALRLDWLPGLRMPLFAAAPAHVVEDVLAVPTEGDFPVAGHLARLVPGKTFEELLILGWDPPIETRARLAKQLSLAVDILEHAGGLVHGDLSPANVIIAEPDSPTPNLCLIDFDGFFHPDVPAVPVTTDRAGGGRSWGTPGYRAPWFRKSEEVVVDSDRVALAILALELVVLRPADADELPGDTLLEQQAIDARCPHFPDEIRARWPEGHELVTQAILARSAADAPTPARWRRALDDFTQSPDAAPSRRSLPVAGPPLPIFVREHARRDRRLRLPRPAGNFGTVSPALSWLGYRVSGRAIRLFGNLPLQSGATVEPIFVRHGGAGSVATRYEVANLDVEAALGDVVHSGDFDIYLG